MEAITGLDSHLCLQSWPAGTHRPLRRTGIIQDRRVVIRSMNPSMTSLGEVRKGGYCAVKTLACVCIKQVSSSLTGVQHGLTGLSSSHICPPHTSHVIGSSPAFCFTSSSHKCWYKWHILFLSELKQFEVYHFLVCTHLFYLWFVFVTAVTVFWHVYQTIIKLNEGHNWKRKLGSTLNLHVCIVQGA